MEKPYFGPSFFRELAADNPLGADITEAEVRAWWHFVVWPRYKTYTYRNHGRAVRRWWARIGFSDLDRAREAMAQAESERAQKAQDFLATTEHVPREPLADGVASVVAAMFK